MKQKPQDLQENSFPSGLSQPALRALNGAGLYNLEQLAAHSESAIKQLHGIGPNAMEKLRLALAANGLAFVGQKKGE